MRRTLISVDPSDFPIPFRAFLQNAQVFDRSCSPEARVWYIQKDRGYFLKRAPKGSLKSEAKMTAYFHRLGLSAEVLAYHSAEQDWLLTAQLRGEDCTQETYLADPKRLCELLAAKLRELHDHPFANCPVPDRISGYIQTATDNYTRGVFDPSYLPTHLQHLSATEAFALLCEGKSMLRCDTLLHGDYCLPNILLDGWVFSGFIDLGNGGVGDRHIDLFWGAWTLAFNLGTDAYRARFFDAYGRERIDPEVLDVIGLAEAFG